MKLFEELVHFSYENERPRCTGGYVDAVLSRTQAHAFAGTGRGAGAEQLIDTHGARSGIACMI
jgi:hypothetical protein